MLNGHEGPVASPGTQAVSVVRGDTSKVGNAHGTQEGQKTGKRAQDTVLSVPSQSSFCTRAMRREVFS